MTEPLLPTGTTVAFTDIESALSRSAELTQSAGIALTGTVVVTGPAERLAEAAEALDRLKAAGRTILISHGDDPAPVPRVCNSHIVALDGLRPKYMNNAVAALRLSCLPTLVWWRGGNTANLEALAQLAERLVLDAHDPRDAWRRVEELAQHTSVTDLRWTRLTRWRALMAHFFDLPEMETAPVDFRTLRVEGSDIHTLRLFGGWILSSLIGQPNRLVFELIEHRKAPPIERVLLAGTQELEIRLAPSLTCLVTSARVRQPSSASRTVSLGDQDLCTLIGEELRIRARDVAFERAVAAAMTLSRAEEPQVVPR